MSTPTIIAPKKLIEVALPLDDINKAGGREKSIRQGHPCTLHLWWSRKPLAVTRAVIFAQVVNDPSWKYTDEDLKRSQIRSAITRKRNDLFKLIRELVLWENSGNQDVLQRARREIFASWKETCEANSGHPEAKTLFDPASLPPFHDPFAGGGAIPLEAQRLGFEAHASDLNPVAVLINKALIDLPPRFAGNHPVGPAPKAEKQTRAGAVEDWAGATGLAEDVRRYGAWLRDEAEKRIGHVYPKVEITKAMAKDRPDLKALVGLSVPVIAWLWVRTVASPNPAAGGAEVPLVGSFLLSTRLGAWVVPKIDRKNAVYEFRVEMRETEPSLTDTVTRQGGICLLTGASIPFSWIRDEAKAGRLGQRLLATVVQGDRQRIYLDPTAEMERIAADVEQVQGLDTPLPDRALGFRVQEYGVLRHRDLFTRRQMLALSTFADLVAEVRDDVCSRALDAGRPMGEPLHNGGKDAAAYSDAVATYLAFVVAATADDLSTVVTWRSSHGTGATRSTFAMQAIPMTWTFAEANPFAGAAGDPVSAARAIALVLARLGDTKGGSAHVADAASDSPVPAALISTDPPYYDNIGYADLSDFFYVWHRRMLSRVFPELFGSILAPKEDELIANPFRHRDRDAADKYFLARMSAALHRLRESEHSAFPATLYYAFKQSETRDEGTASSGWTAFLEALLEAGWMVCGTWPIRTERSGRTRNLDSNALASSIVLVCRVRPLSAIAIARKEFVRQLDRVLPTALAEMTADPIASIAPVDLAQAAIGPGMAIFSRYKAVLEADGEPMSVHSALIHINKAIDTFFAQAEGELDGDTRFCIDWFHQRGFEAGPFGEADVLARAKGTAVDGVVEAGVLVATKGKVRLLRVKEYSKKWDPTTDRRAPVWEACHQMCRALGESEHEAGTLLARMPEKQDAIRQLAYRLYTICERQKWAEEAGLYNELITSWPAIVEQSHAVGHKGTQLELI